MPPKKKSKKKGKAKKTKPSGPPVPPLHELWTLETLHTQYEAALAEVSSLKAEKAQLKDTISELKNDHQIIYEKFKEEFEAQNDKINGLVREAKENEDRRVKGEVRRCEERSDELMMKSRVCGELTSNADTFVRNTALITPRSVACSSLRSSLALSSSQEANKAKMDELGKFAHSAQHTVTKISAEWKAKLVLLREAETAVVRNAQLEIDNSQLNRSIIALKEEVRVGSGEERKTRSERRGAKRRSAAKYSVPHFVLMPTQQHNNTTTSQLRKRERQIFIVSKSRLGESSEVVDKYEFGR